MDPRSKNLVFWRPDSNSPCKTVYIPSWKGLEAKKMLQKCQKCKTVYFPSWKGLEAKKLIPKCQKNKKHDLTLGGDMFGRRIVTI